MINGSRSVLYFGYHGLGKHHYGSYSDDPVYADVCVAPDKCKPSKPGPEGWPVCEDPKQCTTGRKGLRCDGLPNEDPDYRDGC
jgi:hypothetical protein